MSLPRSTVYAPPITSASSPSSIMAADREKRNKSQNVQQDVFHNESLLKDLLRGASDPLLRCQNSTENVCCKIHNFECSLFWF